MKTLLEYSLLAVLGVLVIGSLVGALLDRPVFMSYAYSESMTPTINKGDLFFINPLDRSPEVGDVIVFRVGSTWTVHRVVAIIGDGYVTKGDNNVATDQQSHSIPPIEKDQIGGTVIAPGGRVITVPEVGNYIENGLSDRGKILLGALLIIVGILAFGSGEARRRGERKRFITLKFKTLYLLASSFLLLMIAVSIFVSWEVIPVEYSVTSAVGDREGWYGPGEEFQTEITVKNNNMYPMRYYVSAPEPVTEVSSPEFALSRGGEKDLTITITAPEVTAVYSTKVTLNAYPPLLPESIMEALYRVHPMVPLMAILAVVSAFLGVVYLLSGIGNEDAIRIRRRKRSKLKGIPEVFRL
ncbi:signal peptidase I, S26B family [Thermococcus cleftensis]|uniref:Signal peptidase I, S26B family n=1 Tax=Thermococcus cleftensis (strain DSM 27260 / KACC 17922 / CL1) TaxID=163003 RepID=I3ZTC5_THECF|nr:signal peptidase I [Thermococcus cleftensis]AFL94959.1 signal peptidase I, S26B family [Thermococcus cleftensis]